jgi:peptidoglycan/LPS O-acetylase OafA/YrhL
MIMIRCTSADAASNPLTTGDGDNEPTLRVWMDILRGLGVTAIVLHHWLEAFRLEKTLSPSANMLGLVAEVAGTFVHLFFVVSGCGLALSYFRSERVSWNEWARRRFTKIIVPYWIVLSATFMGVNLLHLLLPDIANNKYSFATWVAYLSFMRNFYNPGWSLNESLWFIPVIVGLYMLFPLLVKVLEKYGTITLMLISVIVTYGSITLCVAAGYPMEHQAALPLFHLSEFSLGILIGYFLCFSRKEFVFFIDLRIFFVGLGSYGVAWVMTQFWALGRAYDDLFIAIGVFAISTQAARWIWRLSPRIAVRILVEVSRTSYIIYLMHFPLIVFVIKPVATNGMHVNLGPVPLILLGWVYLLFLWAIARFAQPFFSALTSRIATTDTKHQKSLPSDA